MFKFSVSLNANIFFNFYIIYIMKGIITIDAVIDYTEFSILQDNAHYYA